MFKVQEVWIFYGLRLTILILETFPRPFTNQTKERQKETNIPPPLVDACRAESAWSAFWRTFSKRFTNKCISSSSIPLTFK